jgi:hypothetical protein
MRNCSLSKLRKRGKSKSPNRYFNLNMHDDLETGTRKSIFKSARGLKFLLFAFVLISVSIYLLFKPNDSSSSDPLFDSLYKNPYCVAEPSYQGWVIYNTGEFSSFRTNSKHSDCEPIENENLLFLSLEDGLDRKGFQVEFFNSPLSECIKNNNIPSSTIYCHSL